MRHLALLLLGSLACTDSGGVSPRDVVDEDQATTETTEAVQTVIGMCLGSCETHEDCWAGDLCLDERLVIEGYDCHAFGEADRIEDHFAEPGVCVDDTDCGARQRCSIGRPRKVCTAPCQPGLCPTERPYCSPSGVCGTCDENLGCFPGTGDWCGLLARPDWGRCVPRCTEDEECPGEYCVQ